MLRMFCGASSAASSAKAFEQCRSSAASIVMAGTGLLLLRYQINHEVANLELNSRLLRLTSLFQDCYFSSAQCSHVCVFGFLATILALRPSPNLVHGAVWSRLLRLTSPNFTLFVMLIQCFVHPTLSSQLRLT